MLLCVVNLVILWNEFMVFYQIIRNCFPLLSIIAFICWTKRRLLFTINWLLSRHTYPRAVFVSSVYNSYWPVREALSLGVPCFGVADTNTLCNFVTVPLPGNDESIECITFYNDSVSNFILVKKFMMVIQWFRSLRISKRLQSFKEWLLLKRLSKFQMPFINQTLNSKKMLSFGVNFFFQLAMHLIIKAVI